MLSLDRFGHTFLCPAVAAHLRGINQAHAERDSQTQRRDFPRTGFLTFTPCPTCLVRAQERAVRRVVRRFSFDSVASGKRESGRKLFSTNFHIRVADNPAECGRKIAYSC